MSTKHRFLVVCAVAQELVALDLPPGIDSLICGIGPVEAGVALATQLAKSPYDLVLNVGIAGGFAPYADVGARIIVTDEYYVELGREDGGELHLPEDMPLITHVPLRNEMHQHLAGSKAVFGPAITSATITTSNARACALRLRFPGVLSESMEGYALARAAECAAIPFLQLRGISNRVGDRTAAGWNLQAGLHAVAALTHEVIHALI